MSLGLMEVNLVYTVIVLAALVALSLIINLVLLVRINQATQRYKTFMKGNTRANIEEHLFNYAREVSEVKDKMAELGKMQNELNHTLKGCAQNVGMVRFDAYENTGGQQSFAIALMDGYGNGLVLSSLHGRTDSHVYAKPIKRGVSAYPLSQEEEQAIQQSIRNKLL